MTHYILRGIRYNNTYERDFEDNLWLAISTKVDMKMHGWQVEIIEKRVDKQSTL